MPQSLNEVVELMRATAARTSHRTLMEGFVLGREGHHALCEKRERLRTLEINEQGLRDKLAAVGLYDDHPVSKQKMAKLHAASESLDGDIRAEVARLDADVAARIKALEESNSAQSGWGMKDWKINHDNDTGPNDDGFSEWWTVTDGEKEFKCVKESDAEWLLDLLTNLTSNRGGRR